MPTDRLKGSIPPLVTPFRDDGEIDWSAWSGLLDWHLASGTAGVIVAGSTGESPTVTDDEVLELLRRARAQLGGRMQVIVGCGSNNTAATVARVRAYSAEGVDGLLHDGDNAVRGGRRGPGGAAGREVLAHQCAPAEARPRGLRAECPAGLQLLPGQSASGGGGVGEDLDVSVEELVQCVLPGHVLLLPHLPVSEVDSASCGLRRGQGRTRPTPRRQSPLRAPSPRGGP